MIIKEAEKLIGKKQYKQPLCEEEEHNFINRQGLGIVTRVCMNCGLKEYRYTGQTLGIVTDWSFDGWAIKDND